jgi:hypothetical protein
MLIAAASVVVAAAFVLWRAPSEIVRVPVRVAARAAAGSDLGKENR